MSDYVRKTEPVTAKKEPVNQQVEPISTPQSLAEQLKQRVKILSKDTDSFNDLSYRTLALKNEEQMVKLI
jgi:hypothetical protein